MIHPDADLFVPLPAAVSKGRRLWAWLESEDAPHGEFGLLVGLDRLTVVGHRGGVPQLPGPETHGVPMAALTVIQPGVVRGAEETFKVPELFGDPSARISVVDGPALWLGFADKDWVIATADPVRLAAEIERRRRRVVRLGGFAAVQCWERVPSLRADLPLPNTPVAPDILPSGTWSPLSFVRVGEPSPGMNALPPMPFNTNMHPTQYADINGVVPGPGGPVGWQLGDRHFTLAGQWRLPLAGIRVAQAGTLTGVPRGHLQSWIGREAEHPTGMGIFDGPALWCWGHHGEFLLCTPDAQRLAAEINARKAACYAHPDQVEKKVWLDFPDSEPNGRQVPAPPPYAPVEPTLVSQSCWQATR